MRRIDTHQHLWDLRKFPYSWCAKIPTLHRDFLLKHYREAATGLGIEKTIFMEGDVDDPYGLAEARDIQELAEREPSIAGIVAGVHPENDDFLPLLEQLATLSAVRGVRRVLHTQPDDISRSRRFVENVNALATFGYTFDLCVLARQLPAAIVLVERCPTVTFILDHCGIPDVKGRAFEPWREHVKRIAEFPNVVCKLSGLVAYADPDNWTVEDLRPWVEHVLTVFGWDRVMWGSDWPVCTLTASLSQWVGAIDELTLRATEEQREHLFFRNAERIYRV
jgi:predicted TIM-barrel fold metal-dependent hydrolase